ncbi:MAG: MlaD family protein [Brevinematia bacterium]
MKHVEFKIGLVVIIGLTLIFLGFYLTNSLPFLDRSYRINVVFKYLANIPVGGSVKLVGGIKIGTVEDLKEKPEEGGVVVTLKIDRRYKINKDASFIIKSTSLVGEKYIDIINYTGEPPFLNDGDTVIGQEISSIDEAIAGLSSFLKKVMKALENKPNLSESFDKLLLAIIYLESVLDELNKNKSYITLTLRNLSESSENLKSSLSSVSKTLSSLESLSKIDVKKLNDSINILSTSSIEIYKILTNKNSLVGLINDEEVNNSLRRTIKNLEVFSKKISDNPSSLINIFR